MENIKEGFTASQLVKRLQEGASFGIFSVFSENNSDFKNQKRDREIQKRVLNDYLRKKYGNFGFVKMDGFYLYKKTDVLKDEFSYMVSNLPYDIIHQINYFFKQDSFIFRPENGKVELHKLIGDDYQITQTFNNIMFNPTIENIKKAGGASKIKDMLFIFVKGEKELGENYQLQLLPM